MTKEQQDPLKGDIMAGVKLFTDSTNDLGFQLIEQHEIGVVPLYVTFGTESFRDGIDISPEQLFEKVQQTGILPKTSAPSPADFYAAFCPYAELGKSIVFIGLSSALSSTIQNALLAAKLLPGVSISVIDSRNLSTGIGLLLLKASDAVAQGATLSEIEDLVKETVPKIETSFVIDTLEYLHKGGRVSNLQHLLGSLLKVRPIVKVADGGMIPAEKIRGKREKAVEKLVRNVMNNKQAIDPRRIFVTHATSLAEAEQIRQILLEKSVAQEIIITETGCVISSHCGPGTIGIVYSRK